mmetsp:Transcript_112324/g.362757  ORF Transcript_112324/g.362757 Transcript_112324/m.362757 type:complete len:496 (+) Transcript_112324:470-1957(+)
MSRWRRGMNLLTRHHPRAHQMQRRRCVRMGGRLRCRCPQSLDHAVTLGQILRSLLQLCDQGLHVSLQRNSPHCMIAGHLGRLLHLLQPRLGLLQQDLGLPQLSLQVACLQGLRLIAGDAAVGDLEVGPCLLQRGLLIPDPVQRALVGYELVVEMCGLAVHLRDLREVRDLCCLQLAQGALQFRRLAPVLAEGALQLLYLALRLLVAVVLQLMHSSNSGRQLVRSARRLWSRVEGILEFRDLLLVTVRQLVRNARRLLNRIEGILEFRDLLLVTVRLRVHRLFRLLGLQLECPHLPFQLGDHIQLYVAAYHATDHAATVAACSIGGPQRLELVEKFNTTSLHLGEAILQLKDLLLLNRIGLLELASPLHGLALRVLRLPKEPPQLRRVGARRRRRRRRRCRRLRLQARDLLHQELLSGLHLGEAILQLKDLLLLSRIGLLELASPLHGLAPRVRCRRLRLQARDLLHQELLSGLSIHRQELKPPDLAQMLLVPDLQ